MIFCIALAFKTSQLQSELNIMAKQLSSRLNSTINEVEGQAVELSLSISLVENHMNEIVKLNFAVQKLTLALNPTTRNLVSQGVVWLKPQKDNSLTANSIWFPTSYVISLKQVA